MSTWVGSGPELPPDDIMIPMSNPLAAHPHILASGLFFS
jgi:hypothetical protein